MANKAGEAYVVFSCSAPRDVVEDITRCANANSDLELSLMDENQEFNGDTQLTDLAQEAKEKGRNYMIHASYPDHTNPETVEELKVDFDNKVYNSPQFPREESFHAEIAYKKEDGHYYIIE